VNELNRQHGTSPSPDPCQLAWQVNELNRQHGDSPLSRPPRACSRVKQLSRHIGLDSTTPLFYLSDMQPTPLYSARNLHPSYRLYYDWSGWPSVGSLPAMPGDAVWDALAASWAPDGLRLLERRWTRDCVHLTFSTTPAVSPVFLAQRAKGRLQHALRGAATPVTFNRKVSVRSTGKNTRATVEQYVAAQVAKEHLADPRYADRLKRHAIHQPEVDLSQPAETGSGRYWYNLHLVLVTDGRLRSIGDHVPAKLHGACLAVAAKKGCDLSRVSFMPDHVHAVMRGNAALSPEEIALAFQNNLAFVLGQRRVWEDTYYVGTFGEYDLKVVRGGSSGD